MPLASSLVAPALCSLVDGCRAAHPYDAESAVTQGKPAFVDIRSMYGNSFRLPAIPYAMPLITQRSKSVWAKPYATCSIVVNSASSLQSKTNEASPNVLVLDNYSTAFVYGMLGTDVATVGTVDMWLYRCDDLRGGRTRRSVRQL
jgi:hypothetical protein